MVRDVEQIYSQLLSQGYADELFSDLKGSRQEGRESRRTCPLCRKDGFSYSIDRPLWRCWNCDEAGDWISYLDAVKGMQFREALQHLADKAGYTLQVMDPRQEREYRETKRRASIQEAAQEFFQAELFMPAGKEELQYLTSRGYTEEEIRAMELGAYVDRSRLKNHLREAGYTEEEIKGSGLLTVGYGESHTISMLWRDTASRAMGLACRTIQPGGERKDKYKYAYGLKKSQGLIGFSSSRGAKQIMVVEGLLDALYLNTKGLRPPVAGIGGKSISADQLKALESTGTEELYICLDMDEAGQQATERILKEGLDTGLSCYVVRLPTGKDPDELVRDQGLQPMEEAIEQASRWSAWLARHQVKRQDLTKDRGQDRAIRAGGQAWRWIIQSYPRERETYRRAFLEAMVEAGAEISSEDLERELDQIEQDEKQIRANNLLSDTADKLHQAAGSGSTLQAEELMEDRLRLLRASRGIKAPSPYLAEEFLSDIGQARQGLSTGYPTLDKVARIPAGALTILAGRPGHGKTTLMLNLLHKMMEADEEQRTWYFYSYEMAKAYIVLSLIMLMAGAELDKEHNHGAYGQYFREGRNDNTKINQALKRYQELAGSGRLIISDERLRGEDLASTIGYMAERGDTGAVFVDYIQKIPIDEARGESMRYLQIARTSQLLLDQAIRQNIPILLGAQVNRPRATGQGGEGSKYPRLSQMRESGDIEQDAWLVLGLHNPAVARQEQDQDGTPAEDEEIQLRLEVLKNRSGMAGKVVQLDWQRSVSRITDPDLRGMNEYSRQAGW